MFLKLKQLFLVIITFAVLMPQLVLAQNLNLGDAGSKSEIVAEKAALPMPEGGIDTLISQIINALFSLIGVIFLALMLYGGYLWMMSKGDEQEVEKSKNIIRAAIFGIIVVVGAYAITSFVLEALIK